MQQMYKKEGKLNEDETIHNILHTIRISARIDVGIYWNGI